MAFTTYENRHNPHVAIHRQDCNQLRKRGGEGRGEYKDHDSMADAKAYASTTGLPVQECSFCQPK